MEREEKKRREGEANSEPSSSSTSAAERTPNDNCARAPGTDRNAPPPPQEPPYGMTEELFVHCKEAFNLFDDDRVGIITKEDLGKLLRAFGLHPTQEEFEHILKESNRVNEDRFTFEETVDVIGPQLKIARNAEEKESLLELLREDCDKDNTGFMNVADFRHFMESLMCSQRNKLNREIIVFELLFVTFLNH